MREAKAAAARRGSTLAAFVSDALERSLRGNAGRPEAGGELRDSMRWYEKHRARLLSLYPGEYIAVVDRRVLDHGKDFEALALRVFEKLGARPIFMPRVQDGEARQRVRSPRLRG